jgi:hypothetical protein
MSGINDDLYIRTSSRFIPELRIPIHAVRQSTVSLQPPRLAFGSVYIGDSRRMSILTSCASGRIHRLTLIEKPPGTEVHISEDPDEPVIIDISFDSDKTGAWNGLFRFSAMSDMGREIIELPAVAYVRNR